MSAKQELIKKLLSEASFASQLKRDSAASFHMLSDKKLRPLNRRMGESYSKRLDNKIKMGLFHNQLKKEQAHIIKKIANAKGRKVDLGKRWEKNKSMTINFWKPKGGWRNYKGGQFSIE